MNRPITSPSPAVLTSSPTITFTPARRPPARCASSAPEISLWSVTAIAPEALLARGREQHLDRRRAVAGVVGVHVQVDVDQRPRRQPLRERRVAVARVAARGQRAVDLLELVGGVARRRRTSR